MRCREIILREWEGGNEENERNRAEWREVVVGLDYFSRPRRIMFTNVLHLEMR